MAKRWAPRFNVHLAKIDASLPLLEKRFLEAWNMWQTLGVNGSCSDWKLDFCWDARCKKWPRSFGSMGLCVLWNAWRICSSQFYPDSATFSWIPAMRPMTTSNQILISGNLTLCRGSKSALTVIPARLVDLVDWSWRFRIFVAEFVRCFVGCNASRPSMTWLLQRISSLHRSGVLPAAGVAIVKAVLFFFSIGPTKHRMCIGWGDHWQREGRGGCGTLQQGRM